MENWTCTDEWGTVDEQFLQEKLKELNDRAITILSDIIIQPAYQPPIQVTPEEVISDSDSDDLPCGQEEFIYKRNNGLLKGIWASWNKGFDESFNEFLEGRRQAELIDEHHERSVDEHHVSPVDFANHPESFEAFERNAVLEESFANGVEHLESLSEPADPDNFVALEHNTVLEDSIIDEVKMLIHADLNYDKDIMVIYDSEEEDFFIQPYF